MKHEWRFLKLVSTHFPGNTKHWLRNCKKKVSVETNVIILETWFLISGHGKPMSWNLNTVKGHVYAKMKIKVTLLLMESQVKFHLETSGTKEKLNGSMFHLLQLFGRMLQHQHGGDWSFISMRPCPLTFITGIPYSVVTLSFLPSVTCLSLHLLHWLCCCCFGESSCFCVESCCHLWNMFTKGQFKKRLEYNTGCKKRFTIRDSQLFWLVTPQNEKKNNIYLWSHVNSYILHPAWNQQ